MYTEEQLEEFRKIIGASRRAVFFSGAGVSEESGIPDFTSQEGPGGWKYPYPLEYILSSTFFRTHTEEFFAIYRDNFIHLKAKPNAAHFKLAQWEREGKLAAVITQNIDGLHQTAGSKNVLEIHGSVRRNRCVRCRRRCSLKRLMNSSGVPLCSCGGVIKPDVVLNERPFDGEVLEKAVEFICMADTLIIGGASPDVNPAAGMIDYFVGENLVVINNGLQSSEVKGALMIDCSVSSFFEKV